MALWDSKINLTFLNLPEMVHWQPLMTGLLKPSVRTKSHSLFIVTVADFQGICFYYKAFWWLGSLFYCLLKLAVLGMQRSEIAASIRKEISH